MKESTRRSARSRAEILADIAGLPNAVRGKISSYKNVRKNGSVVVYHNLQCWANGRNHSLFIPEGRLDAVREALENGRRMNELVAELSRTDAETILSSDSPVKKSSRKSSSGDPRASTNS